MHKTQVFLSIEGDHFRTRLTHTLEVAQISRSIARGLALNEDLTEAIALGHDLGHTPFGHMGEAVLDKVYPGGFKHNEQSLRIVDVIENYKGSRGLNLTFEVRDGILNHTGPVKPVTLEGQIVKTADRIAYINHDIDDALRSGLITQEDLPKESVKLLGEKHGERINTLVLDMIHESDGRDEIHMSDEVTKHMNILREFLFENVYHSDRVVKAANMERSEKIITSLYRYYAENPEELPDDLRGMIEEYSVEEMSKDFVAGMTDRYAIGQYEKLFEK